MKATIDGTFPSTVAPLKENIKSVRPHFQAEVDCHLESAQMLWAETATSQLDSCARVLAQDLLNDGSHVPNIDIIACYI